MKSNYYLLIGKVKDIKIDRVETPHIELLIEAKGRLYRASIILESKKYPHRLLYKKIVNYKNPLLKKLKLLDHGLVEIKDKNSRLAIEYDTGDFVDESKMRKVPYKKPGANNDLLDYLFSIFNKTIDNPFVTLYIYGEIWESQKEHDYYFGFYPARGIHDIHKRRKYGNYSMDGCVFIRTLDKWTAIFLAFQEEKR